MCLAYNLPLQDEKESREFVGGQEVENDQNSVMKENDDVKKRKNQENQGNMREKRQKRVLNQEIQDGGPDVTCATRTCQQAFHAACLGSWFASLPGRRDAGLGKCPYCDEMISV